ncbi:MAG: FeoA family protein [Methanomicrobiales archaeon]|nr:FeoA family protein [Methanomicrobiales archaeon]
MELPLVQLGEGERGVVTRVIGGVGMSYHLGALGIRGGKILTVVARHPFGGPVVIEIDGRAITIGRGIAARIWVEKK